jgi:hypothetical protein
MSKIVTCAPDFAKARADAAPRPDAPPVTTAIVLLFICIEISSSFLPQAE